MPDYKSMYFALAGSVADAVESLEELEDAADILRDGLRLTLAALQKAQQQGEDAYTRDENPPIELPSP